MSIPLGRHRPSVAPTARARTAAFIPQPRGDQRDMRAVLGAVAFTQDRGFTSGWGFSGAFIGGRDENDDEIGLKQ